MIKTIGKLALLGIAAISLACEPDRTGNCDNYKPGMRCDSISNRKTYTDSEFMQFMFKNKYSKCGTHQNVYCCCGPYKKDGSVSPPLDKGTKPDSVIVQDKTIWPDIWMPDLQSIDQKVDQIITDESKGVSIIIDELKKQGYLPEKNLGKYKITLRNPKTGKYDLVLTPDIAFRKKLTDPYSYFEFDSKADPGKGIVSKIPFYYEIKPNYESKIRLSVTNFLKNLIP